jgi:hypothetical protein
MKYICTITSDDNEEIFVFPYSINHDSMMEVIHRIKYQLGSNWTRIQRNPVSAGFVSEVNECYGKSETLMLDSRLTIDTLLLKKQLSKNYNH